MSEIMTGRKISAKEFLRFAAGSKVASPWCLSEAKDIMRMYAEKKLLIFEACDSESSDTLGAIALFVFPPIISEGGWGKMKKVAYVFGRGFVAACVCNARFSIGLLVAAVSDEISSLLILDIHQRTKALEINTFVTNDRRSTSLGFMPNIVGSGEVVYALPTSMIKK